MWRPRARWALAAEVDLAWDTNADGRVDDIEGERDYAFVTHATGGLLVFVLDLTALATTTLIDIDVNGVDDRVLEVVPIPAIQPGSPAVVLPDLGMVFVGGDGGAAGIQVGAPEIVFVRSDGSGELLP